MSFYLILSSDASLSEYPENTLSHFINKLSEPLRLDNTWMVALQAISISNCSKIEKNVSKVYIYLNEIFKQNSIHQSNTLLKVFNTTSTTNSCCYHEVINREYFPLKNSQINELKIEIKDINGKILNLPWGQPTFIKLKFKKMDTTNNFVLQLSSGLSTNYYSNNHSKFTNKLNSPIKLTGQWKVALSSIIIPGVLNEIITPDFEVLVYKANELKSFKKIKMDVTDFKSNVTLQRAIIARFKILSGLSVKFNNGILSMFCTSGTGYNFDFPYMFAYVLGITKTVQEKYTKLIIDPPKMLTATVSEFPIDISRLKQNVILLYSDIIKPFHTCSIKTKLLKLIPTQMENEEGKPFISYESQHLDFLDLEKNEISNISIELRKSTGEFSTFKTTSGNVHVSLLFKKYI